MKRLIVSLAVSVCLVALIDRPASAQSFVTYASVTGDDGNSCDSPATPCRTLAEALSQTVGSGLIHVSPGEYQAVTISKSVEILVDGGYASVFTSTISDVPDVTGGAGVVVDLGPGEVVHISGFTVASEHAIAVTGSGFVHISNSIVFGAGARYGIVYVPSGAGELYISDSRVFRSPGAATGGGILIRPIGSGSANVTLDNVRFEDNVVGILVDGTATTGANSVTVRNVVIAGSSGFGVRATDSSGGATNVSLEQSTISNNATNGVVATGAKATVRVSNSTVTGNAKGLSTNSGGRIISLGGNVVSGNTVNGAFTSTVAQK